jgi:outer membrane protein TolC
MKSRIVLAAALWTVATAHAQPGATEPTTEPTVDPGEGPEANAMMPINLDQVIEVAVRVSPNVARARIDRTVANHQAAGERRAQAWTMTANTSFSQSGIADHVEAPPYSVVEQDTLAADVGMQRALPTGGQLQFGVGVEHKHTEYSLLDTLLTQTAQQQTGMGMGSNMPTDEDAYQIQSSVKVTYKQPLMRGFGSVAVANEKKADLLASEATIKAQLAAEDMIKDLVTGYWELAYATYEVDTRFQALELAKKQEQLTHEQMRGGTVPPSAINAVEYEIFVRDEARLTAQTTLEQKSMELRRLAGLELTKRSVVLRPSEPMEIGDDEFDVDEVLARSKIANRKLATIQIEKKIAMVDVEVARDQRKPQVDLNVQGSLIGLGDTTADSFSGIGNHDGYAVTVGLSMSWELSGAASRAHTAAQTKTRRLDIDRADAERQIETQTALAVKAVAASRTRVALSTKAIAIAEENLRTERANFLVARTTNFQVMQRQTELIEARLRRGRAVADYHIAVAQLQYLSGLLLDQYRIDVKPRGERS